MNLLMEETAIGAKLALAHGGTGVKVGPGEIKTPSASPVSPPKLRNCFLAQLVSQLLIATS